MCGIDLKDRIVKKIAYALCIVVVCFNISGCGLVPSVELTQEQTELVAEYAAGMLLKYVKGHESGLMRVSDLDFSELNTTPTPTPIPTPEPVVPEPVIEDSEALVDDNEGSKGESMEITLVPMNEAFSLNGAELNFSYGEVVDSYPSDEGELVFAMTATPGMDLLILHFDLSNPTGSDLNLATNLDGYKTRVLINGEDKIRSEITFLTNDLLNYSNTLEAGATDDVVLVFEINEGMQIDTLNLLLVKGSDQMVYNLV